MANVYHWLTGSRDDVYSGKRLNYGSIVTNSSRYGSDSAFQVGTTTGANDTMSTNYTYGGSEPVATGLPNLGTGDATIAFWWQPNNSAYGGSGQRHLFQYSTGLEVYHNASISTDTQDDYNLVAKFNYGASGGFITKTFDIDLTGNPWIKIYASRIGGAFYYTLFDATGSVITDNDGNQATWSNSSYTNDIYNASGSTPHIRVGGDFASGQTAGGIYDDIFLTLGHGIASGDLETDSDGYAKIDPVINSFSTSATSATSGSSVTLSWDTDFGTTLQLLKYVGGLLTNTETVTGQVSKSVTISETVSYKLRATNVYGTVDSQSVQINLSQGGNNMGKNLTSNDGLVIQREHIIAGGDIADVLVAENPFHAVAGTQEDLNTVLSSIKSYADGKDASLDTYIDGVSSDLDTEEARAAAAEGSLQTRLSSEEVARSDADASIGVVMNAGFTSLDSYIDGVSGDLDTEEARAAAAEGSLQTRLSSEEVARSDADASIGVVMNAGFTSLDSYIDGVSGDLDTEEARAAAAEGSLQTRLSSEEVARSDADASIGVVMNAGFTSLDSYIDGVSGDLDTEEARAAAAEGSLQTRLSSEEVARSDADASIGVVMNAGFTSLDSYIDGVSGDLDTEEARAAAAEGSLQTRLSSEEVARSDADASIGVVINGHVNSLDSYIDGVSGDLDTEEARAAAAEGSLQTRLSSEEVARSDADASIGVVMNAGFTSLDSYIDGVSGDLDTEEARAAAAEGSLQTRLSSEEVARSDADASIGVVMNAGFTSLDSYIDGVSGDLDTEEARAAAAEGSLQTRLSSEEVARSDADASIGVVMNAGFTSLDSYIDGVSGDLDTEEARAAAAEGSLQTRLSSEEVARSDADASIGVVINGHVNSLDSYIDGVSGDLDTEEARAAAAEGSLQTRLAAEESARATKDNSLETRMDSIDTRSGNLRWTQGTNTGGELLLGDDGDFSVKLVFEDSAVVGADEPITLTITHKS